MRIEGADQRPRLAFRPQGGIDFEEDLRSQPHHLPRHPGGERVGVLPDEDDVHVADIVQLAGPALTHRDDSQTWRCDALFAHRGHGYFQCGSERGVSQV